MLIVDRWSCFFTPKSLHPLSLAVHLSVGKQHLRGGLLSTATHESDSETLGWFLPIRHWPSLAGAARLRAISVLFVESHKIRGHADNPYAGILVNTRS